MVNYGSSAEQILLTLVGEHEMLSGKENKMLFYFVLVAMPCVQVIPMAISLPKSALFSHSSERLRKTSLVFCFVLFLLFCHTRWRIKFVDDLTVLEALPRNSPSLLNVVVDDN
ncbi:unnamed protein product [Porites lobata]|uniref:Uncharacterized protein n=1 Tax=Porites lobata TaxID=104759 RepID=A0ABN8Q038_9CNID|nr:unnamed protein product [Porites lobata]